MAAESSGKKNLDAAGDGSESVKVICLGDSAVGKSKLVERFLLDKYKPQQQSTYAVTLYNYEMEMGGRRINVDLWDTAGQERFSTMHPSYYHGAHSCILVFDVTRKVTYKNLPNWYTELRQHRPHIPCLLVANKIDVNLKVTERSFNFAKKYKLPLYFVSASDGTNVVKVFREAIRTALAYKENSQDILDHIMEELRRMDDLSQVKVESSSPAGSDDGSASPLETESTTQAHSQDSTN